MILIESDASIKKKTIQLNHTGRKLIKFTDGIPICGYDNILYDYVSFVIIQKHTDGYTVKVITSSQNANSSNDNCDVFDFKLQGGTVNIWYI